MCDITSERPALVKTSGIIPGSPVDQSGDFERALENGDVPGVHRFASQTNFYKSTPAELVEGSQQPVFGEFFDQDTLKQSLVAVIGTGTGTGGSGFLRTAKRSDEVANSVAGRGIHILGTARNGFQFRKACSFSEMLNHQFFIRAVSRIHDVLFAHLDIQPSAEQSTVRQ